MYIMKLVIVQLIRNMRDFNDRYF